VVKYGRHRRKKASGDPWADRDDAWPEGPIPGADEAGDGSDAPDWFAPPEEGEEAYAARMDVPLAAMLMLGVNPWQRIDGMGMARQALETAPTGDSRRDLTVEERFLLANGRAWCLAVHADLARGARRDDPFVVSDASRQLELAQAADPGNPQALTTLSLVRLRQGRPPEALEAAREAVRVFGSLPDEQRTGRTQGAALLALVTLALVTAVSGDREAAQVLAEAAQAVRSPLDLDEAAFAALLGELGELSSPDA